MMALDILREVKKPHLGRGKYKRRARTHCKNGHPWVPRNIYYYPNPEKGYNCRVCVAARNRVWYAKNRSVKRER